MMATILKEAYYVFTLAHLSLLLPISFSVLAKLSIVEHHLTLSPQPFSAPVSVLLSFFLHAKLPLLHALVSIVTLTALLRNFTGRVQNRFGKSLFQPGLNIAWIFLCILQICVGFGLQALITSGIWPANYSVPNGMFSALSGTVFVGLYHTMVHWTKTIVKPIIDDTFFGVRREETRVEKVAIAASFGILWWWRLRDEIGSLALLVEDKRELATGLEMVDLISWLLYYLTIAIGVVRFIKGLIWLGKKMSCRVPECNPSCPMDDDKV